MDKTGIAREKTRLSGVVDEFKNEMLSRLNEKADLSWAGWDEELSVSSEDIANNIRENLNNGIARWGTQGDFIDIANYAMFLWYRFR